jgi:heme-degrading monooxygenase HmoA
VGGSRVDDEKGTNYLKRKKGEKTGFGRNYEHLEEQVQKCHGYHTISLFISG